ncbi:MAG: RING finger protein [Promethearchaeota archaeon]
MGQVLVFTLIDRFLWGIAVCIMILGSLMYLTRAHKIDNRNEKRMLYAFGLLFIALSINTFFLYVCEISIQGTYIDHSFYANMDETKVFGGQYEKNSAFRFFYILALYSWFIGALIFIFIFENIHQRFFKSKEIKKPKYSLTIIGIILVIMAAFNFDLASLVFVTTVLLIIGIIFWLSIISSKELQAVSIVIIMGIDLIYLAAQIHIVNHIIKFPTIFAPILMIIGIIFIISPFFVDMDFLVQKKPILHWKLLIIFSSAVLFIGILFVIISDLPFILSFLYISQTLLINGGLIFFGVIQKHKGEAIEMHIKQIISKSEREELQYLFRGFTKPKQLTEEEVSIAKERRICLVCKNKLARNIYICPDCNAFYCQKCSTTLASMENTCWVCDAQIDESKPIKKSEIEKITQEEGIIESKPIKK